VRGIVLSSLAASLVLFTGACTSGSPSTPLPAPDPAASARPDRFPAYADVDDSLSRLMTSIRYRIAYTRDDMWRGAPTGALVTIVDFSDVECRYCARLARNIRKVVDANPDDVRLVVKMFPLDKHPAARPASEAILAAHAQGRGFAMYETVFAGAPDLSRADLITYAEQAGVPDLDRFITDIDQSVYAGAVDADIALGKQFKIRSTPNFFINGRPESGVKSVEELTRMIEDERIFARKLIKAGSAPDEVYPRIMRSAKKKRWATW
jgi:protein-disulfide isomerase